MPHHNQATNSATLLVFYLRAVIHTVCECVGAWEHGLVRPSTFVDGTPYPVRRLEDYMLSPQGNGYT